MMRYSDDPELGDQLPSVDAIRATSDVRRKKSFCTCRNISCLAFLIAIVMIVGIGVGVANKNEESVVDALKDIEKKVEDELRDIDGTDATTSFKFVGYFTTASPPENVASPTSAPVAATTTTTTTTTDIVVTTEIDVADPAGDSTSAPPDDGTTAADVGGDEDPNVDAIPTEPDNGVDATPTADGDSLSDGGTTVAVGAITTFITAAVDTFD